MIQERPQNRQVTVGIVAGLAVIFLVFFLLQGRVTPPASDSLPTAEETEVKVAAAHTVLNDQPEDGDDVTTNTPLPTASATASATPTPTSSPTATTTPVPTVTRTPEPIGQSVRGASLSVSQPTLQSEPQDETNTPTPPPLDCLDATYLADVTISDGTHLEKGEGFLKTWRVRNSGTCDWPEDTGLVFAYGDQMSAPDSVAVGALAVGETTEISVEMTAPDANDNFQGSWRFATGGDNFGTLLTVVIRVGEEPTPNPEAPPPAPAPPPPPPSGHIGGGFELGGHVANFGNAAQMHYAGMKWAKVQMHHGGDASGVIAEAHANGLKILVGAVGDAGRAADPGYQEEFAGWLGAVAAQGADAIEIWNEPNIDREWAQGQIDPAAYTEMLRRAYTAIKNNNPGTMVISAALSPTWHNPPYHWGDDVYLSGMVASGAAYYVDCYGIHYNSGTVPPSQTGGAITGDHYSWYFWGMINTYWAASGGTRPLCFTELGYLSGGGYCQLPDNFAWAASTTVEQQAAWLAQAAVLASSSGKVRLMIIWNVNFTRFDCGPGNGDPQAGYGIIRPGGGCPACETLHSVTH
jgi:hypothetical protein